MKTLLSLAILCALLCARPVRSADISIVGSSTVYPFMHHVADLFARQTKTRIALEPTGTETGFDYFCAGTADYLPDINNASFAMTLQQFRNCQRNGVRDILAFAIGFDGIVVFSDAASPLDALSLTGIYRAVAAEVPVMGSLKPNNGKTWSDIDAQLPKAPIRVLGPPPTSGTRAFLEYEVIKVACEREIGRPVSGVAMERRCRTVRKDGIYVNVSEDDQFLIDAVAQSHHTIGLVGYGQFQMAGTRVKALAIDGVQPTVTDIASGRYPQSRPLFVYVKAASLKRQPELANLLTLLLGDQVIGADGALAKIGLIPPSEETRAENRTRLNTGQVLECPSLFCVTAPIR